MSAILFDLDGTLLNTLDDLADAVNVTLTHFGCPERSLEEVRQFVGNGAERLIRLALPGKADDPDVFTVLAYFKDYYAVHAQVKTRPYDGVLEALEEVKKEFPVAIVSNKPDGAVKLLCKQYFGDVYALGESSGCPRKPAPDMVHKAMEAIGAQSCIYVGDSEVDVLTAQNAGVPCLSVLWGFRDRNVLEEAGAAYFCEDPKDLLKALKEMI
mgnify:FL=1